MQTISIVNTVLEVSALNIWEPGRGPIYFTDQTPQKSKCHIMHT